MSTFFAGAAELFARAAMRHSHYAAFLVKTRLPCTFLSRFEATNSFTNEWDSRHQFSKIRLS
jgi:hypothetical protein